MKDHVERGKVGSLFEDSLKEQGTHEETTERAIKLVIAHKLETVVQQQKMPKVEVLKN